MWLLHIVLIWCLEDATFTLLVMEKSQLDLDVHGIFKFLNALLHSAKIAREIVFRILFDKRENNGQLIEEIVDCMQNWMQRKICVCWEEKLMLHEHSYFYAEFLFSTRRIAYHIFMIWEFN